MLKTKNFRGSCRDNQCPFLTKCTFFLKLCTCYLIQHDWAKPDTIETGWLSNPFILHSLLSGWVRWTGGQCSYQFIVWIGAEYIYISQSHSLPLHGRLRCSIHWNISHYCHFFTIKLISHVQLHENRYLDNRYTHQLWPLGQLTRISSDTVIYN